MIIMGYEGTISEEITNDDNHRQLIREQNKIGWMQFFKGRISKKFKTIQQTHYDELSKVYEDEGKQISMRLTGEWWTKNMIRRIVYYSLTQWQIRNNKVHDEMSKVEKRDEGKMEINKKIIEWYEKKDTVPKQMKYLFKLPLIDRCMKSIRTNEAWLHTFPRKCEIVPTQNNAVHSPT